MIQQEINHAELCDVLVYNPPKKILKTYMYTM